jgi:hypothetical protein
MEQLIMKVNIESVKVQPTVFSATMHRGQEIDLAVPPLFDGHWLGRRSKTRHPRPGMSANRLKPCA